MRSEELKKLLMGGALRQYSELYSDIDKQTKRMIGAIERFEERFGKGRDVMLLSVPGRSEIAGNHTDHNRGKVMAGAIDRDIIAVAAKTDVGMIRFLSEGYPEDKVDLSQIDDPAQFKNYSSASLIAGVAKGIKNLGRKIGGYDAYATSEVLKGSGISSSAAYEVMIGNILNHFYCSGKLSGVELAKVAQFAENEYFGKPCGLMDQMACAVGGFVYIDFNKEKYPIVEPIDFSLTKAGYSLCIVNTGGNHADLNDDYASVPAEMKSVAKLLGGDVLRGLTEEDLVKNLKNLRRLVGDRAILRSLHFLRENERVEKIRAALVAGDVPSFLSGVLESGRSSFEYLQNVYTTVNVKEQGLSLALALADGYLAGKGCAFRVHGGGFAGTIQVFIKNELIDGFVDLMDSVFGLGSAMTLRIRPLGACRLF